MAGTTTYYGISYPTNTDYVKDGATAMQTIATGFDSAVAIPTYNNQTGTTYTFVLADTGKTVTSNNASAVTFTIPPQVDVAWANNATLTVRNLGAGVVTIAGGAGVTVTNTAQTIAQYGEVKLIRTASNAWTVVPASGGAQTDTIIASADFTTTSTINLTNVLSSTYKFYDLYFMSIGSTTDAINLRFRENTTDVTTNYYVAGQSISSTYTIANYNSGSPITQITFNNNKASAYCGAHMTFFRQDATQGVMFGTAYNISSSLRVVTGAERTGMTNFTGLSIYTSGGTMSGTYILTGRK